MQGRLERLSAPPGRSCDSPPVAPGRRVEVINVAVPKKKVPRSKRGSRRAFQKLDATAKGKCPRCHEDKLPHRACPGCGYYKDFEVIKVKD